MRTKNTKNNNKKQQKKKNDLSKFLGLPVTSYGPGNNCLVSHRQVRENTSKHVVKKKIKTYIYFMNK